jgi:hypothetical protein
MEALSPCLGKQVELAFFGLDFLGENTLTPRYSWRVELAFITGASGRNYLDSSLSTTGETASIDWISGRLLLRLLAYFGRVAVRNHCTAPGPLLLRLSCQYEWAKAATTSAVFFSVRIYLDSSPFSVGCSWQLLDDIWIALVSLRLPIL